MPVLLTADHVVALTQRQVFAFLEQLDNHWQLSDRFDVRELHHDSSGCEIGATVCVRGPLGLIRRTVETRVLEVDPPRRMRGDGASGSSHGLVTWTLTPLGETRTRVQLAIEFDRLSRIERAALAIGGGIWLRREMQAIVREVGTSVGG